MITFRTFGRLDLRMDDGAEFSSVLVHPKRVALLAYLCTARPRGFHRRDTLLALFWPELDQERARAALRKAVHYLRRSLGPEVLPGRGDDEIGIDSARLWCDAAAFDEAIEQADPERAFELYQGPFLEGFFVQDGAGFEEWLERERARLHRRVFDAAWSLAERSRDHGDAYGAAHWARRASSLLPDDEGALRRLVSLLDAVGDRAGALSAYEEFARRLVRDYEARPSPETEMLVRRVRADAEPPSDAEPPTASETLPVAAADSRPAAITRRKRSTLVVAAVAALLLPFLLVPALRELRRGEEADPLPGRFVAILPFAFRGSEEFAYLADGMVSLLSTDLNHLGDIRAVDAAAVLTLKEARAEELNSAVGSEVARQLGAGLFVLGDIVEVNGRLRLSAGLYEAPESTREIARGEAEGKTDELFELVDEIATELVANERRSPAERITRLAGLTTHSIPALKAYLQGEGQFRAGRYNEAVESFQAAVAADTTFALGYYRLALALMWGSSEGDNDAAERAVRYGARLSSPDRALLEALLPFLRGDAEEAERQYRAILVRRPEESEVWYPLGEVLFHHNSMRGRRAAEARTAFERALALGPKDGPLTHLIEIAGIERDYVAFDSLFTGIQPASHFFYVGQMVQAMVRGDEAARQRVLAALADSSDARLITAGRHAMFLLDDNADITPVLRLMTDFARPRDVRSWGHVHLAHLAAGAGRIETARAELRHALRADPDRAMVHEAWLFLMPIIETSREEMASLRERLAAWQPRVESAPEGELVLRGDVNLQRPVRSYLLGLLDAKLGNTDAALRTADALLASGDTTATGMLAEDLGHAIRSEVHREGGRLAEALAELELARMQFDSNLLEAAPFYGQVRERFIRAELLAATGNFEGALAWLSAMEEHGPWSRALLARALLRRAEIEDALGERDAAARHYARFVDLWREADPPLRPMLDRAKQRLEQLQAAGAAR